MLMNIILFQAWPKLYDIFIFIGTIYKIYCLWFHYDFYLGIEVGTTCPAPVADWYPFAIICSEIRKKNDQGELKREIPLGHFFLFSEQVIVTGFNSCPVVHIFGWLLAEGSTDKRSARVQTVRYTFKFDSSPIMGLGLVNSKQ